MRDLSHLDFAGAEPVAPAPALLQAHGLGFRRGGEPLIESVDLELFAGRRMVVLGHNGAGKSLLLRLLHGLIAPSAGKITWQGRALDAEAYRAQAMVFQRPVMLRRSVSANLAFALAVRGVHGAERAERVAEALAHARLTDLARRPARVLSGGEQQRLAIARALVCRPRLLMLDEPTASLDPVSTQAVEDLIHAAQATGCAIVLVTHDLGQARRMADDVVFLHRGRIAESGSAASVLERPRSEAAAAWLSGRLYLGA